MQLPCTGVVKTVKNQSKPATVHLTVPKNINVSLQWAL
uniref:Uncharacterized protein n=1 Tax=Anguilla anguilla TaxID=7936 RepID=A0A0E9PGX4_ANGAN